MFAAHPDVAYLPETSFVRRFIATGVLERLFASAGEDAVISRLQKDKPLSRTGLNASLLFKRALTNGGALDAAIYREMVLDYAGTDHTWVGDKDPRLIEFLPLVKVIFPNAQIINVIRDPRDVLLSKKKAAWSSGGHAWKHVFANRVQLKMGCKNGPLLFGENYHEIIYEDLLENPRDVLSDLCQKIDLHFDESMLSFSEAAKKLVSASELSWKQETLGPLLRNNKEKWEKSLSTREILLTESCCREALTMGKFRFYNGSQKPGLLDWLWLQTAAFGIKLATLPYIYYRNHKLKKRCIQLG